MSLVTLTACDFHPLYSEKTAGQTGSRLFEGVQVDDLAGSGRMGQQFRIALEKQLNPDGVVPLRPAYKLTPTLVSSASAIGVARDGTVSRYNVYLSSNYTMTRISDNRVVATGSVRHVSSYNNITNAYFSTYISEQDAIKRGVEELAEIYRSRLAATLDAGAPPLANPPKPPVPGAPAAPESPWPTNPWENMPWQSNGPSTVRH